MRVRRQIASYTTRIPNECDPAPRFLFDKVSNDFYDKQYEGTKNAEFLSYSLSLDIL